MATKLGATPWTVHIPLQGLMVVGFDTYHNKMGVAKNRSMGAVVASLDKGCTK